MFAALVYLLCALTSFVCMTLLIRAYRQSRARILLWSAICFVGLAANNILLLIDLVVLPQFDLTFPRLLATFGGLAALLTALIWEGER